MHITVQEQHIPHMGTIIAIHTICNKQLHIIVHEQQTPNIGAIPVAIHKQDGIPNKTKQIKIPTATVKNISDAQIRLPIAPMQNIPIRETPITNKQA